MDAGKESLRLGVKELRPGNMFVHWAQAVQQHVEGKHHFHLIRGLGGHGIGRKLHGPPFVSNVVPDSHNEWPDATLACRPGILVAVEPMIALGTSKTRQKKNEWPVYTADGSLSVHYEHDVLITEKGPRLLSEGMDDLPDIVG
jgi:methionyl aminopeptidase